MHYFTIEIKVLFCIKVITKVHIIHSVTGIKNGVCNTHTTAPSGINKIIHNIVFVRERKTEAMESFF